MPLSVTTFFMLGEFPPNRTAQRGMPEQAARSEVQLKACSARDPGRFCSTARPASRPRDLSRLVTAG
jgi:hypothetical protein